MERGLGVESPIAESELGIDDEVIVSARLENVGVRSSEHKDFEEA